MEILVPISPGELIDKITILRIKLTRIADEAKIAHVRHELSLLEAAWSRITRSATVTDAEKALSEVNEKLWAVEDQLRAREATQNFDTTFVTLARSVYLNNDERAAIKKRVNLELGSALVEEKSYTDYMPEGLHGR